jgi:hypothetical protein
MASIVDIEIFPLVSFIIFFTLFTSMLIWVITMKKSYADYMSAMPVNDDDELNLNV